MMKNVIPTLIISVTLAACAAGPVEQAGGKGNAPAEAGDETSQQDTKTEPKCQVIKRTGSRTGVRVCK